MTDQEPESTPSTQSARPIPSTSTTPSDTPSSTSTTQAPAHKPFPSITGSCLCSHIRYRLLTSPLFVYACHCTDCQKTTGSAFATFLNIELYNIALLSPTPPAVINQAKRPELITKHVACPQCKTALWSTSLLGAGIAEVRVGTLDFAGLFEPDVHSFVESKVGWLTLPAHAKTTARHFQHRELWPRQSLKRLQVCVARVAAAEAKRKRVEELVQAHVPGEVQVERPVVTAHSRRGGGAGGLRADGGEDGGGGDGEKTPTAVGSLDVVDEGEGESDEAFEMRYKETERVLQARLEKLSQKLKEEESKKDEDLERLTANLELADTKCRGKEIEKDGGS